MRARARVLGAHTSAHRARQFERYVRKKQAGSRTSAAARSRSLPPVLRG